MRLWATMTASENTQRARKIHQKNDSFTTSKASEIARYAAPPDRSNDGLNPSGSGEDDPGAHQAVGRVHPRNCNNREVALREKNPSLGNARCHLDADAKTLNPSFDGTLKAASAAILRTQLPPNQTRSRTEHGKKPNPGCAYCGPR